MNARTCLEAIAAMPDRRLVETKTTHSTSLAFVTSEGRSMSWLRPSLRTSRAVLPQMTQSVPRLFSHLRVWRQIRRFL